MKEIISVISGINIIDIIDILFVALVFYSLFSLIKETRSAVAMRGLISLLIGSFTLFFFAKISNLRAMTLIFERFWIVGLMLFIIVFQNEFRRALTQLGQRRLFRHFFEQNSDFLEDLVKAVSGMSNRRIGALIVLEQKNSLKVYLDTGTRINADVTSELIRTIFTPPTALHDGAIIIEGNRIAAAGCILPLTNNPDISKKLGTRHRAAIGLSEETDAIVIVVSEETGNISLAINGKLTSPQTPENLQKVLENLLDIKRKEAEEDESSSKINL